MDFDRVARLRSYGTVIGLVGGINLQFCWSFRRVHSKSKNKQRRPSQELHFDSSKSRVRLVRVVADSENRDVSDVQRVAG